MNLPNSNTTSDPKPRFDATDFAESDPQADTDFGGVQLDYVGRWNALVSTTNWEKGRIISQWRDALVQAGAEPSQFSDEVWAARVGGVTSPHVGRLRRVYARFGEEYATYQGLYWSHFLAALDWDDAPLWLQGAVEEGWSVAGMRNQRWSANGELESERPQVGQIVTADTDEDVMDFGTIPAQGGGRQRDYGDESSNVSSGPAYEQPDFGDAEPFAPERGGDSAVGFAAVENSDAPGSPVKPFAGLPALPDDLSDVMESLKLAILRHKSGGFEHVSADVIRRYLQAMTLLIE